MTNPGEIGARVAVTLLVMCSRCRVIMAIPLIQVAVIHSLGNTGALLSSLTLLMES